MYRVREIRIRKRRGEGRCNGAYKICETCKRPHYVPKYRIATTRFCSRRCLGLAMLPEINGPRLAAVRGQHSYNFAACRIVCRWCKKKFFCSPSRRKQKKFCSQRCYGEWQCVHDWTRYKRITTPDGRRMFEHRYVMELVLGRRLLPSEQVDHINRHKRDNRRKNLRLIDPSTHGRLSSSYRGKPIQAARLGG